VSKTKRDYPPQFIVVLCKLIGFCISKIFWRIRFSGTENIPKDMPGGLIVAANHQTYIDPVWICLKINRKVRFMAWDRAFDWFIIGRLIRYLGAFPVGLNRRGYVQASRKALQVLKDGATLIIFPEGEREFSDGNLLPFKLGAVRLAMEANVPILPVSIRGGNKIWAQDIRFPRFNKVEIIYHPLLKIEPSENPVQLQLYAKEMNSNLFEIISNR
jgi:1-acyl-sn-glycerol-3-phosphate acyltransferase